jgi:hypothetical protein
VTVLVVLTGICAFGVLFLLRFLIALCQDSEPGDAVHLLRVTPTHTGSDVPDPGETTEHSTGSDHRVVRRRRAIDRPAATAVPWNAMGVASSNEAAFGKVSSKAR